MTKRSCFFLFHDWHRTKLLSDEEAREAVSNELGFGGFDPTPLGKERFYANSVCLECGKRDLRLDKYMEQYRQTLTSEMKRSKSRKRKAEEMMHNSYFPCTECSGTGTVWDWDKAFKTLAFWKWRKDCKYCKGASGQPWPEFFEDDCISDTVKGWIDKQLSESFDFQPDAAAHPNCRCYIDPQSVAPAPIRPWRPKPDGEPARNHPRPKGAGWTKQGTKVHTFEREADSNDDDILFRVGEAVKPKENPMPTTLKDHLSEGFGAIFDQLPSERQMQIDAAVLQLFTSMHTFELLPSTFPQMVPQLSQIQLNQLRYLAFAAQSVTELAKDLDEAVTPKVHTIRVVTAKDFAFGSDELAIPIGRLTDLTSKDDVVILTAKKDSGTFQRLDAFVQHIESLELLPGRKVCVSDELFKSLLRPGCQ